MFHRRNGGSSNQTSSWSGCLSLLTRIHHQHCLDEWSKIIRNIQKRSLKFFICLIILIIFQCPNRVYNGLNGPFPINLKEFRSRLRMNSVLPFNWGFFYSEYVQIELGNDMIEEHAKTTYRVFYRHHSYGNLLYIFNRVRQSASDTTKTTLYAKFSADGQSYSQQRYPYHFQSFNMNTLKCILTEMSTSSREWQDLPEKSMYIKKIEKIYDKEPKPFNKRVIKTCGILIGYLYQPMYEYVYPSHSYEQLQFTDYVQVFDASSPYTPYISYILSIIFTGFLCKFIVDVVGAIVTFINTPLPIIHSSIAKQMKKSNFESVENLDEILLNTTKENNHHDRLFIVNGRYVIMLKVELTENKKEILRKFFENPPLIIIPIDTIRIVKDNHIILNNNNQNLWIEFPMHSLKRNFEPAAWLHERLMIIDDRYRHNWEEEERLRHLKEARIAQERERKHRLRLLIDEETKYQQRHYGQDFNRMILRITSASPRFIAEFRLSERQMITEDLADTKCTICLEDFRLKPRFAQWPCPGKHFFHFDCMLDVLRAGNTCPLCRFPVEPADLPTPQAFLRLLFGGMIPNVFH